MGAYRLASSLIVRIELRRKTQRIVVHNLHTQELLEFATWAEFVGYAQTLTQAKRLR